MRSPSVDSGKEKGAGSDVKSLPAEYDGMSNIHSNTIPARW